MGRMEDENELPYMLWEKRDDKRSGSNVKHESNDVKLKKILNSLYLTDHQRRVLKNKLTEFLNARDVRDLTIEDGFEGMSFIFTRANEYVRTTHELIYLPGIAEARIFMDAYTSHDYTGLLQNRRFNDMIKRIGLEFYKCAGGYVLDYSGRDDRFTMRDELDVRVHLKAGSKIRVYDLDLERMELSEKYFEYDF